MKMLDIAFPAPMQNTELFGFRKACFDGSRNHLSVQSTGSLLIAIISVKIFISHSTTFIVPEGTKELSAVEKCRSTI